MKIRDWNKYKIWHIQFTTEQTVSLSSRNQINTRLQLKKRRKKRRKSLRHECGLASGQFHRIQRIYCHIHWHREKRLCEIVYAQLFIRVLQPEDWDLVFFSVLVPFASTSITHFCMSVYCVCVYYRTVYNG